MAELRTGIIRAFEG